MIIDDLHKKFLTCSSACTDTRKLLKNCMYFALKGDNFDGNKFAHDAKKNGAKFCVIDDKSIEKAEGFILVDNVLSTLQELSRFHRQYLDIPIISLTGSNGKTTTKELIKVVLSQSFRVKATSGNLNNHIGVPLTLLSFDGTLDFGIVEMGANHQKEIEFLCGIAQPDYGLITNFGKAHLEGFGGIEGVIKGKSEMYDYLKSDSKTIVLNTDDEKQLEKVGHYKKLIKFGSSLKNDCQIIFNGAKPFVSLSFDKLMINSQLIGSYNYNNIAVAIAIGKHFNVPSINIKNAIESYIPDSNRSELKTVKSNKVILDAYNANPTSMLAALENFQRLEGKNKFLFLGDMFELGEASLNEHQSIVNYLEQNFVNNIFLTGEHFFNTKSKPFIKKFQNFFDLKVFLDNTKVENALILVKGSRGMALERILPML